MSDAKNAVRHDCPFLVIQEGNGRNREFSLEHNSAVLGRDQDCDVILSDLNVSRHHAMLSREPEGVIVKDLSSANGTFVNAQPVSSQMLKHLDTIQVGGVIIVFNDPGIASHGETGSRWANLSEESLNFDNLRQVIRDLEKNISIVFKGNQEVIRNLIVCLLADGHLLLEDAPGVGKSMLAQALARSIFSRYRRIQFTPDMMPSDVTGMNIYDSGSGKFRFIRRILGSVKTGIDRFPKRASSVSP